MGKTSIKGIYEIVAPDNHVYIGQSVNIKRRFADYHKLRCKSQTKLYNSFQKHGIENHKFNIIYKADNSINKQDLSELERIFVKLYKKRKIQLLNIAPTGKSFFYPAWRASLIPTAEGRKKFWENYKKTKKCK